MEGDFDKENVEKIEKRFFSIAEMTGQLIFDGDAKTGKIEWSGPIKEFTGYTQEEFSKMDLAACKDLIHPEDRDRVWCALEKSLRTGRNLGKNSGSGKQMGAIFMWKIAQFFLKIKITVYTGQSAC
ncbi:MAG: PAS domain-containing protein [Methanosarcina barkeri]|nr:PAS domain-containing protein [Methanosarcina sp. ERenArc_MAG2]